MKKIVFLVLFILMSVSPVYAGQQKRIELTDGGVFEGEIVSLHEGKYTIKSPSVGIFTVAASRVRNMRDLEGTVGSVSSGTDVVQLPGAAAPSPNIAPDPSEVQRLQSAIISNPEIISSIPGLVATPDFQALLQDPEIMSAAKSMDIKALMTNPKIMKAINNPAVKEIAQKVKEKNG